MVRFLVLLGLIASGAACGGSRELTPPIRATTRTVNTAAEFDPATVAGSVDAPDGAPATDAIVAVNRVDGDPVAIVHVDAGGRFRVARPKERFAVTATSSRGTAVFVAPADAAESAPLRLRLGRPTDGFAIEGTISAVSGALPSDTFVRAARWSSDEGDIFYAPMTKSGAFTVHVPPGLYWLRPSSESLMAFSTGARGDAGDHTQVRIEASLREPAPQEVVGWLRDRALRIATTDPQAQTDDLDAVARLLAKARVIGVGEATHGTREYFRLKHRLLQRLVIDHGVTLLAMEANFSDAERVDAWVQTGHGTIEDAMKGLFRVWRTEEVRDLLVWMRDWNANPKHKKKIRFRGYDVQGSRQSLAALHAYLRKVDRSAERDLLDPLATLDVDTNARGMIELGAGETDALRKAIAELLGRFVEAKTRYVARSSSSEYELVLHHAHVLEQALTRFAAKGNSEQFESRDRAMAENVVWLSEQIAKDERMMVWAHNGHIQLDAATLPAANMGTHLRERLGKDYLAAGFVLDEGSYRAWVKPNDPAIADVVVGPHEPGWVAEAFARVGKPIFAVDLRGAPAGPVRDWLFAPHVLHSCGWLVSEEERKGELDVLGRAFDVAIYVAHTTSARQLPKGP